MWHFALAPLLLCARDEETAILLLIGFATIHWSRQKYRPSTQHPDSIVSARIAPTSTEGIGDGERVANPRRLWSDLVPEQGATLGVTGSHIAGFNRQPSRESRARLLSRQRNEMKQGRF